MQERQQHRAGNSDLGWNLKIDPNRQSVGTTGMSMMLHRTAVLIMAILFRSFAHLMISTAGFDDVTALAGGDAIPCENAGVQANEYAEKQQTCEKHSHERSDGGRLWP